MVYVIIIMLLTAADQAIKWIVTNQIGPTDQIPVIESFFFLVNRQNRGAAWSFLADQAWGIYVLAGVSLIVTIVMLGILLRSVNNRLKICLTIIIGGSIGNLIDRVRLLYVTDYLDFHFGNYVFPTFNLADMLVVCGTLLLCMLLLSDPSLLEGSAKHQGDISTIQSPPSDDPNKQTASDDSTLNEQANVDGSIAEVN
jgi:signal peptidase II